MPERNALQPVDSRPEGLAELVLRSNEGDLDAAGHARLVSLLDDPAVRSAYTDLMMTVSVLDWEAGEDTHTARAADMAVGSVIMEGVIDRERAASMVVALDEDDLLEEMPGNAWRGWRPPEATDGTPVRVFVIPTAAVWIGVAAAVMLAAIIFWSKPAGNPAPSTAARPTPNDDHSRAAVAPVADLIESFDAAWESGFSVGSLQPGHYRLTHGWVKLRTRHGVEVVLEAPAAFSLDADNAMTLDLGNVVAEVPRSASGFTVRTPGGRVVDRGTAFGVSVDSTGAALAHVFMGEVEAVSDGARGPRTLTARTNEAALLKPDGTLAHRPAAPGRFAREVPATPYQAAVMRSRPMCYWRGPLNTSTGELRDYGWLGADAQASGLGADRVGFSADDPSGSLDFGNLSRGEVSVPYRDAFEFTGAFAIEVWCWVSPEHDKFMRVVSTRREQGGIGLGVNGSDANSIVSAVPNVPVLTFFGQRDIVGHRTLPTGRWTHLVATVDARGEVRLFINGAACPFTTTNVTSQETDRSDEPGDTPLMIGRNPFVTIRGGLQAWQGGLDEIAIYDRALTEDEVLEHYNALPRP